MSQFTLSCSPRKQGAALIVDENGFKRFLQCGCGLDRRSCSPPPIDFTKHSLIFFSGGDSGCSAPTFQFKVLKDDARKTYDVVFVAAGERGSALTCMRFFPFLTWATVPKLPPGYRVLYGFTPVTAEDPCASTLEHAQLTWPALIEAPIDREKLRARVAAEVAAYRAPVLQREGKEYRLPAPALLIDLLAAVGKSEEAASYASDVSGNGAFTLARLFAVKGDMERAEAFARLIGDGSSVGLVHAWRFEATRDESDRAKALKALERRPHLSGGSGLRYAAAARILGRNDVAERVLESVREPPRSSAPSRSYRDEMGYDYPGLALMALHRYDEAATAFASSSEWIPSVPNLIGKGMAHLKSGARDMARQAFAEARARNVNGLPPPPMQDLGISSRDIDTAVTSLGLPRFADPPRIEAILDALRSAMSDAAEPAR